MTVYDGEIVKPIKTKKFNLGKNLYEYLKLFFGIFCVVFAIYLLGDIIIGIFLFFVGFALIGSFFFDNWWF